MNEQLLSKFILTYLIDKEDYLQMTKAQQEVAFDTFKTIMTAIYQAIKHENVYPVIMCGDVEAKNVIEQALAHIQEVLPSTDKITINLIH
tara:strand:+ start:13524 stop:13793 length:270 start_codon:yes stop_codon:yes gene_type:complete